MAPRRTKAASRIKPPYARGEPEDYTVPPTYPWPREEGTEISITDLNIPKSSETRWDKEASRRYNTLLNTNIFPTRFVDAGALSDLGLHEDLHAVLQVLGIADLCHRTHPLYPDLDKNQKPELLKPEQSLIFRSSRSAKDSHTTLRTVRGEITS
ncbi:hypothetical protein F2Q68_00040035 [Brassica cretica]|uniref:Uncharacterized protein n=1 Tax=Brassica cretica TaxID=69181 RepID=A0A8S9MQZ5_BRACR|nr:hypothetical protein F2Q68_00040035 [Brassica cretica]